MKLTAFFVLDHAAKCLRDGVEECGLADAGVTDQSYLETEVVIVIVLAGGHHLIPSWHLIASELVRRREVLATADAKGWCEPSSRLLHW